jgi:hypothetical protein
MQTTASPTQVLSTDTQAIQKLELDAGYCFGMCLDMAKVLLQLQHYGKPQQLPEFTDLSPAGWEVVRAHYQPGDAHGNRSLIKACGMRVSESLPLTGFGSHFLQLCYSLIDRKGTSVLGLVGYDGSHEMVWHRDDENGVWFFFDPYSGLWQFESMVGVAPCLAAELQARYEALGQLYRVSTLHLK